MTAPSPHLPTEAEFDQLPESLRIALMHIARPIDHQGQPKPLSIQQISIATNISPARLQRQMRIAFRKLRQAAENQDTQP